MKFRFLQMCVKKISQLKSYFETLIKLFLLNYTILLMHDVRFSCSLTHPGRFHVEDFCDATLHDEEVGIVDVELHRPKHVLNSRVVGIVSIDKVLVTTSYHNLKHKIVLQSFFKRYTSLISLRSFLMEPFMLLNLACDGNFIVLLITERTMFLVTVVEYNANSCLCHTSLSVLVDKLL